MTEQTQQEIDAEMKELEELKEQLKEQTPVECPQKKIRAKREPKKKLHPEQDKENIPPKQDPVSGKVVDQQEVQLEQEPVQDQEVAKLQDEQPCEQIECETKPACKGKSDEEKLKLRDAKRKKQLERLKYLQERLAKRGRFSENQSKALARVIANQDSSDEDGQQSVHDEHKVPEQTPQLDEVTMYVETEQKRGKEPGLSGEVNKSQPAKRVLQKQVFKADSQELLKQIREQKQKILERMRSYQKV